MKQYLRKNGVRLAAAVIAAALLVGVGTHFLGGQANILTNTAGAMRAPFYKAATSFVSWLEGVYGYLNKYDKLLNEIEELRAQLAAAQEEARLGADAREENERLREVLNLQQRHADFVFETARIVSWTSSNWASSFTISKGASSGLEPGQCVITEYGALVGQIIETGDSWASVRTIIDVDMDVGALVGEAGNAAIIVGDFSLMQKGQVKLSYLTEGAQTLTGDTILTSGKGGMYPQGLLIGTVVSRETEAGGQTHYAIVEPSCELDSLSQIVIIKEFTIVE